MIGCYILAKYAEYSDQRVFSYGIGISGHTLKHVFAAFAVVPMLFVTSLYKGDADAVN